MRWPIAATDEFVGVSAPLKPEGRQPQKKIQRGHGGAVGTIENGVADPNKTLRRGGWSTAHAARIAF